MEKSVSGGKRTTMERRQKNHSTTIDSTDGEETTAPAADWFTRDRLMDSIGGGADVRKSLDGALDVHNTPSLGGSIEKDTSTLCVASLLK